MVADVDLGRRQRLQGRIQRCRLARAGRPGHQDDAVGRRYHMLPACLVVIGKAELDEILDDYIRVEHPHHQFLAERGRQGRQAQFNLVAVGRACLDPSVLRAPLFDHVHAAEDLDAAGHRRHHRHGDLVDLVQHPVDTEAHYAQLAPRLQMDVARALVERVLPQPVDNVDDVLVVGVELLAGPAHLDQPFEVADPRSLVSGLLRSLDGTRQVVELDLETRDVLGIGEDAPDVQPQDGLEFLFPLREVRLAGRDDDLARGHLHWQDPEAGGIGIGHDLGHRPEIDLQGIDVQVLQAHPAAIHSVSHSRFMTLLGGCPDFHFWSAMTTSG